MMILVEGGTFQMGSLTGMADERPVHSVTLDDFYMEDHLVTQAEWKKTMGDNPSFFCDRVTRGETRAKHPVERVSHYDCCVYCNKRSAAEKLEPCYVINGSDDPDSWGPVPEEQNAMWDRVECRWGAGGYRMPTESEWEYAARGGKKIGPKKISRDWDESRSWNKVSSDCSTHAVCLKPPSALGFHDLFGDVWEWCWDWYDCYKAVERANPRGGAFSPGSADRIGRGGAWNADSADCSPFFRNCGSPAARYNFIGLRVARSKVE